MEDLKIRGPFKIRMNVQKSYQKYCMCSMLNVRPIFSREKMYD